MQIYTGTCGGNEKDLEKIKQLELGLMISAEPDKKYKNYVCAIDNGAYMAWKRGFPWSEKRFIDLLEKCWTTGINAEFIVCPDIVQGGMDSYNFSISWIKKLRPARLALAVQDGITINDIIIADLKYFTHIFIGGSVDWKWKTAEQWVNFAHENGKKCHIGKCGTLERLIYANKIGADSVDSTSFVRNKSWDIIEDYRETKNPQLSLFSN